MDDISKLEARRCKEMELMKLKDDVDTLWAARNTVGKSEEYKDELCTLLGMLEDLSSEEIDDLDHCKICALWMMLYALMAFPDLRRAEADNLVFLLTRAGLDIFRGLSVLGLDVLLQAGMKEPD